MLKHDLFNIRWCYFPETKKKVPGVYIIENIYLGASRDIRKRILNHLHAIKRGSHLNTDLSISLLPKIKNNEQINVILLSNDPFEESFYKGIYGFERVGSEKFYHELYQKSK